MSPTLTRLTEEILALPSEDRTRLVETVIDSLDTMQPEIEALWIEECKQRLADYDAGRMEAYPAEEVFGNLARED